MKRQEKHMEENPKKGQIIEYLEMLLPENWANLDLGARRRFIHGGRFGEVPEGTVKKHRVCALEIWMELFQSDTKLLTDFQAKDIHQVLRQVEGWSEYTKGSGKLRLGKLYGVQKAFVRSDSEEASGVFSVSAE